MYKKSQIYADATMRNNATCSKAPKKIRQMRAQLVDKQTETTRQFFSLCNNVILIHHIYHYSLS
jgi:hypothetical protein